MRFIPVTLALCAAAPAAAAPVILDFEGGVGTITSPGFSARYVEEGFAVDAFGIFFDEEDIVEGLEFFVDVVSLADPQTEIYKLSTLNGQPFDLLAMSVGAGTNYQIIYATSFADGTSTDEAVPATRSPALRVAGERADGSSIDVEVDLSETPSGPSGGDLTGFGLTRLDTASIRLGLVAGGNDACDPETLALRADPSVGVPLFCGPDATLREDVIDIDAFATADPSNWFVLGSTDGFTVAPIPLPAGLPLLAGGLGLLAWVRRRR
jgi:hypothetical protein